MSSKQATKLYNAWKKTTADAAKAEAKWRKALARAKPEADPLHIEKRAKDQLVDAAARRLMSFVLNHKGWSWDGERAPRFIGPTR